MLYTIGTVDFVYIVVAYRDIVTIANQVSNAYCFALRLLGRDGRKFFVIGPRDQ